MSSDTYWKEKQLTWRDLLASFILVTGLLTSALLVISTNEHKAYSNLVSSDFHLVSG